VTSVVIGDVTDRNYYCHSKQRPWFPTSVQCIGPIGSLSWLTEIPLQIFSLRITVEMRKRPLGVFQTGNSVIDGFPDPDFLIPVYTQFPSSGIMHCTWSQQGFKM
jgi:hypothetical protein